jgi:hypothetical protein
MKSRAASLLFVLIASSLPAACGDAGDHFGEFRQTGARVVPVTNVQLSVPTFNGGAGVFPVVITAFEANGHSIPIPNSFTNPIVLTSAGPCAGLFATDKSSNDFAETINVTNTTTQAYVQLMCSPSTISAKSVDMKQAVTISL